MGICGERVCPPFCRECFLTQGDSYEPRSRVVTYSVFLMEEEVDGFLRGERDDLLVELADTPAALRLVELPCCRRIFFSGELDSTIECAMQSGEIHAVACPQCRTPLQSSWYRRQSRLIKARQQVLWEVHQAVAAAHGTAASNYAERADAAAKLLQSVLNAQSCPILQEALDKYFEEPRPVKPNPPGKKAKNKGHQKFKKLEEEWNKSRDSLEHGRKAIQDLVAHHCTENKSPESLFQLCDLLCETMFFCLDNPPKASEAVSSFLGVVLMVSDLLRKHHQMRRSKEWSEHFSHFLRDPSSFGRKVIEYLIGLFREGLVHITEQIEQIVWANRNLQLKHLQIRIQIIQREEQRTAASDNAATAFTPRALDKQHDFSEYEALIEQLWTRADEHVRQQQFFRRGQMPMVFHRNHCLRLSCSSFQRFIRGCTTTAANAGQLNQDHFELAFHGTGSPEAVRAVLCRGFDIARRSGQAHGPGEYFAVQPETSEPYTRNINMMLLCAILSKDANGRAIPAVHPHQGIWVVENRVDDAFVLPLGVITYGNATGNPGRCTVPVPAHVGTLLAALDDIQKRTSKKTILSQEEDEHFKRFLTTTEQTLIELEQRMLQVVPSRDVLLGITAAMGVTAGHWYKCACGYLYVIADCGGAMVRATCPTCHREIGGDNHRLVQSSQSAAGMIQPGAQPAWPT